MKIFNIQNTLFFKILLVITYIIYSGSLLQNISFKPSLILLGGFALYFFIYIIYIKKDKKTKFIFYILLSFILLNVIKLLFQDNNGIGFYIQISCMLLITFGTFLLYDKKNIYKIFCLIIYFTAVISLILYIMINIFPSLDQCFIKIINNNGAIYRTLLIYNYFPNARIRNCGFFWEPGIYSSYICLALLIYNCYKNNMKINCKFYNVILFISGLSTISIAGFIQLFFVCLILGIKNKYLKEEYIKYFIFFSGIILLGVIFFISSIDINYDYNHSEIYNILSKLNISNLIHNNRIISIPFNLKMGTFSLLLGNSIVTSISPNIINDISSLTYLFNVYGLFGILYPILFFLPFVKQKKFDISVLLLVILLLIMYNKEPHHLFLFSWYFLFERFLNADKGGTEID